MTLKRPLIRAATITTVSVIAVTVLANGARYALGETTVTGLFVACVAAALVGVSATLCALMGQAFPRVAEGVGVAVLVTVGAFFALQWPFTAVAVSDTVSIATLGASCTALTLLAPKALNSLSYEHLRTQAANWDAAVAFSSTLDFSLTATVYRGRPHIGRSLRAVYPHLMLPLVFWVRDAVGLLRTPKRFVLAICTVAAASVLLHASTFSLTNVSFSTLLAAAVGVLLFGALGVLGQGLRHAVHTVTDYPLYGVSNRVLVVCHGAFPWTSSIIIVAGATALSVSILGIPFLAALLNGVLLITLVLIARLTNDMKDPLPPRLLAPVDTPFGDMGIVIQLAWALSGPLLAAIAGAAIAVLPRSPVPLAITAVCITAYGLFCAFRARYTQL